MLQLALTVIACSPMPSQRVVGESLVVDTIQSPSATTGHPSTPLADADDDGCSPAAAVLLNEVSPSNAEALVDVEGESVDWIELYNADVGPVDLSGWSLSDDPDEPGKWSFPSVSLDPGAFLLVHASGEDRARIVGAWDTRVDQGHAWRYLAVREAPDPDWFLPDHDDRDWAIGPSGFGMNDEDDATVVEANTVYVRTEVELTAADLADLVALVMHVDYDDGFAAYLNGVEVARVGLGLPGSEPPAWDALAVPSHEATLYGGGLPAYVDLEEAMALLHEGTNTLALEVHNADEDSSDLTLVPFLTLGFAGPRATSAAPVLALPTVDLHTSFSLRASGEPLRLSDPAGCEADAVAPAPLRRDESYGRQPDGTGALGYFLEPTPGGPNVTESRPGFAAPPMFAPAPGHYAGGTDVTLTASTGARVHVAWEGREPTEDDPVYGAPLHTGDDGEAVVLRARAFEDGLWPSRIATATYLLEEPGPLPIVSIVTDPPNLWDEETGIYAVHYDEDWERPVHLEQWEPDGALGFSVDGAVAIQGGSSRDHAQKNLEVSLGGGWGDDAIEHEVFPGLGITSFDRLVLRAGGQDWLGCYEEGCLAGTLSRDRLMSALTDGADLDRMASRPAVAYVNGEYWGIYFLNEKSDLAWVEAHHGTEDIDLLRGEAIPQHGDEVAWHEVLAWLRESDLEDPASYAHVQTLIDVEELQDYLAFEIFFANTDWPGNNIEYWRPRTEDGRWRWLMFGTDFGLGQRELPSADTLAAALEPNGDGWPNPPWSTELFRLLVQSPEFRDSFVNRYADHLNTLLLPERTQALNRAFADEIAHEIPRHAERWGSWTDGVATHTLPDGAAVWDQEVDHVDGWLRDRPDHARRHVVQHFDLDGTWTLTLDADPPGSGTFELTAVTVEPPFTGTYFEGIPVTITAIPALGYSFAGWTDSDLPAEAVLTVEPDGSLDLIARFD